MADEVTGALHVSGKVTLNSSGYGEIYFSVSNAWQRWEVDSVVVRTSQAATDTPFPTATVYAGFIADAFTQGATWTGNQDTFSGRVDVDDGTDLIVVFSGGIAGTTATAIVYGKRYTRIS